MKFKIDSPGAIAKLFLLRYPLCQVATDDDIQTLKGILESIWDSALRAALVKAKEVHQETNPGGCKILSKAMAGEDCRCFLCQADELIAATGWRANPMTTPEERERWARISREAGGDIEGSAWWIVSRLIAHVDALELNRSWCSDILEKELRCRHATIRTVSESLKRSPLNATHKGPRPAATSAARGAREHGGDRPDGG